MKKFIAIILMLVLVLGLFAFGLGLLAGCWLESEFVRNCIGVGLIACGVLILQRK